MTLQYFAFSKVRGRFDLARDFMSVEMFDYIYMLLIYLRILDGIFQGLEEGESFTGSLTTNNQI